ncbi:MAG TPA: phosphonate C-P lyase system protein PhnH, partial [Burkholderiaceae bacterium]
EVASLSSGARLLLSGPGIERHARLNVGGVAADFWRRRIEIEAEFPRGVDLLLVCGSSLVGLPRSTHLALEG